MKKILLVIFAVSLIGNILSLGVLDRALFYRDKIGTEESEFFNQGIRITDLKHIQQKQLSPVVMMLGGNMVRYWYLPEVSGKLLYNWGGVEETSSETEAKLLKVLEHFSPQMVILNLGFCPIHTAVFAERDIDKVIANNLSILRRMIVLAQGHGTVPVLSSLPPVRSYYLLPFTGWFELSDGKKDIENQALLAYNAEIRQLADSENLPFIDFYAALVNASGKLTKEYALTDGEHLSAAGYRVLNDLLVNELERMASKEKGLL